MWVYPKPSGGAIPLYEGQVADISELEADTHACIMSLFGLFGLCGPPYLQVTSFSN